MSQKAKTIIANSSHELINELDVMIENKQKIVSMVHTTNNHYVVVYEEKDSFVIEGGSHILELI